MDATALPKGHIIGWAQSTAESASTAKPLSKSAKKNAKRREKKAEKKEVPEDWEEDEEEGGGSTPSTVKDVQANGHAPSTKETVGADRAQDIPHWAAAPDPERDPTTVESSEDILAAEVKKMAL
jgi:partner of Y14 and mago protein